MADFMTSKERMLTAFRNEQPDMVPVSPDISNMIPAKITGKPLGMGGDAYWKMANDMGDAGTTGLGAWLPGFQDLFGLIDGGLEEICRLYMRRPDLIEAYRKIVHEYTISYVERGLQIQPEFLCTGGSGMMTFQSPRIFRELSLPTLKEITKMAKEADIPSHVHCCGLEKRLVEIAANETDLSSIEPLEPPPGGDCDLAEIKKLYGKKIALKGNIQTTKFLMATPEEVERMAKWCIDVAGEEGGFVLSTGDQVSRDTPEENILKLIEVGRKYGKYPLSRR
jgi:uroporphyrinogen decarboxylase